MDEEDKADAEEAKKLQTTESFAGLGRGTDAESKGDSFMDILKTGGETMGTKLLKKMGWREGQGVGPKVRRKARLGEDRGQEGAPTEETHLFAPENSHMISFIRKDDRKGLGFEGEEGLHVSETRTTATAQNDDPVEEGGAIASFEDLANGKQTKSKKQERKGGFGVGILNDNGSDDEDPYHMGPSISYNRIIGGDKKKKKKLEAGRSASNPLLKSKPLFISKKSASSKGKSIRRCHDGRLPLDGFVLSSDPDPLKSILSLDGKYLPPTIPEGWKSAKVSSKSSALDSTTYQSSADVAKASNLSPKSRARLLGESQLPGKSVFDYLTPNARTKIADATNNPNLPPALGEANSNVPKTGSRTLNSVVPLLARETALAALGRGTGGWMPYAEDPAKRARYRLFLEIRASLRPDGTLPDRADGASNDEWVNEMNEFAHAAQLFKPMTGMMATRFTSASSAPKLASDNMKLEGNADSADETQLLSQPAGKKKTPAEEAAAIGMYGPLTRSVENFYPTRLLCKRFNVKPPAHVQVDPGEAPPGFDEMASRAGHGPGEPTPTHSTALPQKRLELVGKGDMDDLKMSGGGIRSSEQLQQSTEGNGDAALKQEEHENQGLIDPDRNDALEKERPGEAVFRAIFGSDSEEE